MGYVRVMFFFLGLCIACAAVAGVFFAYRSILGAIDHRIERLGFKSRFADWGPKVAGGVMLMFWLLPLIPTLFGNKDIGSYWGFWLTVLAVALVALVAAALITWAVCSMRIIGHKD